MSDTQDRLRKQVNTSLNIALGLVVLLAAFLGFLVISSSIEKDNRLEKEEAECLQPLRESWDAGKPRWEILEDCEHRSGRYGGILGTNARAREWIRWEGRERAWIAAHSNASQSDMTDRDDLRRMIRQMILEEEAD